MGDTCSRSSNKCFVFCSKKGSRENEKTEIVRDPLAPFGVTVGSCRIGLANRYASIRAARDFDKEAYLVRMS